MDAYCVLLCADVVRVVFSSSDVRADLDRILAGTALSIHVCVGVKIYKVKTELRKAMKESRQSSAPSPLRSVEDPFYTPEDNILVTTSIQHNFSHGDSRSQSTTPETDQTTRSSTPCSPTKSPGHQSLLVPLNPNSPHRHNKTLLIGKHRATAYAAPLASGDFATLPSPRVPIFQPTEHAAHVKRCNDDAAALSYFNAALLLLVALVVVWVPSSINRLHQLAHADADAASYGLNLASALVLPSQGLWNAAVYAQATWPECRRAYAAVVARRAAGR